MSSHEWGRVDEGGNVFVRTAEGERCVGQYADGSAEEALAFYVDRYQALAGEVNLLEQRVNSGVLAPEEASSSVKTLREQVRVANAVGDLAALAARLDALRPVLASQREAKKAEKAQRVAESRSAKERIAAEAEKLAEGSDWRNGAHRFRDLLEEWKALPRIDRAGDDALWRRFSGARTTYTRRRKAHFAEQQERREGSRVVKERLAKEAESLAGSTDWGSTAGRFRDLMRQWKSAGPASREEEEALWQRFRGAQDTFFGARDAENAKVEEEYAANAAVKEQLLAEAEALLPIQDLDTAKKALRDIGERWEAAGKVPRDRIKELEGRLRKVEQEIRGLEDEQWRRIDPEKSARADDMVGKLETAIADLEADLEKARAAGDQKRVKELEDNLDSRRSFLEMAKLASQEFSG